MLENLSKSIVLRKALRAKRATSISNYACKNGHLEMVIINIRICRSYFGYFEIFEGQWRKLLKIFLARYALVILLTLFKEYDEEDKL